MEVTSKLTGRCNDEAFRQVLEGMYDADGSMKGLSYNFKHFPAPEGGAFDYPPRLVRQETLFRPKERIFGEASIILKESAYDPWSEVEVVRMLGAMYMKGDNSMLEGKVVAEVDFLKFAPYAFLKWDMK